MTTASNVKPVGTIDLLSAGATISLPWHEFLQEMEVEIVAGGAWTGKLKLFDDQGDRLEKLVIAAGKDRDIDFQWGWSDQNDNFQREFIGSIMHYVPEFMPHGTLLNLEVVARSAFKQVIDKQIRSFAEGRLVSDIVQEIADERGWTSIIETTEGAVLQPFNSKGESDFKFIRDVLQPQAVNTNGSDFICYFDEADTFHFHSPSYQGEGQTLTQHNYRFARDISGDVISFVPQDNQLFGALYGGGNSLFSSPVSSEGGQAEQQAQQGAGVGGAPAAVDASAQIDLGDGLHSRLNIVARDTAEVERLTRARAAEFRRYAFKASLRAHGTHRVRVGHYINVDYTKTDGTPHYLSGNFQVFKIKHVVGVGLGWTTEFELLREGVESLSGTVPITATSTVTPTPGGSSGDISIPASA